MSKEKITLYYGKIKNLASELPESAKKGERETYAGRSLLLYGLKDRYGISFPCKEKGIKMLKDALEKGKKGKPFLKNHPEIHFNISHCADYAVCAFSEHEVGVDIQKIQSLKIPGVISRAMSLDEQAQIHASSEPDRTFCTLWSQKESYVKWTGEGIGRDLKELKMESAAQKFFYIKGDRAFLSKEDTDLESEGEKASDAAYVGCLTSGNSFSVCLKRVF